MVDAALHGTIKNEALAAHVRTEAPSRDDDAIAHSADRCQSIPTVVTDNDNPGAAPPASLPLCQGTHIVQVGAPCCTAMGRCCTVMGPLIVQLVAGVVLFVQFWGPLYSFGTLVAQQRRPVLYRDGALC